jgi:hypothetical protein
MRASEGVKQQRCRTSHQAGTKRNAKTKGQGAAKAA